VFDDALTQVLAVDLDQSPYLDIVSKDRTRETLKLMGRSADAQLTDSVAREVCRWQGLKAMLTGSIAPLGTHYTIGLDAVNCSGESLASIQKFDAPLEEVTTSLEALKAFSAGEEYPAHGGANGEAMRFYKHAIELDPDFALAYDRNGGDLRQRR
jgi:hypothetical protein